MTIVSIKQKPRKQKERSVRKYAEVRKNPFKKLVAAMTAFLILSTLSVSALAANIGAEAAKQIALEDAGYSVSDVKYIRADRESDDGIKVWNVEFHVEEDGRYKDYDYEIAVSDGRILERDVDYERGYSDDAYENRFEAFINAILAWLRSFFR